MHKLLQFTHKLIRFMRKFKTVSVKSNYDFWLGKQ